ncbi:MAG: PEGA domain-containing protein [Myxococcales bacterium]
MSVRLAWVGLAALLAACATPKSAGQPAAAPPAAHPAAEAARPAQAAAASSGIRFSVDPRDARIIVNGRDLGTVETLGANGALRLDPGLYRVTLRREGFETWRAEVAVRGGFERIQVQLVKQQLR